LFDKTKEWGRGDPIYVQFPIATFAEDFCLRFILLLMGNHLMVMHLMLLNITTLGIIVVFDSQNTIALMAIFND
jgi:hypothetical protein